MQRQRSAKLWHRDIALAGRERDVVVCRVQAIVRRVTDDEELGHVAEESCRGDGAVASVRGVGV